MARPSLVDLPGTVRRPARLPSPRLDPAVAQAGAAPPPAAVGVLLGLARDQLGLPVAFLSRFDAGQRELMAVSSAEPLPVGPGFREPLDQTHCQRIVAGTMPAVVPDVAAEPSAHVGIPAVQAFGIGAFAGVPVHLPDGRLYGTLCCLGFEAQPDLRRRDERSLRVLASALGALLAEHLAAEQARQEVVHRVHVVLADGGPTLAYQPIVRLDTLRPVGFEALSRFPGSDLPVEGWFADAESVGLASLLDSRVLERAVRRLPDVDGCYLGVNVSPTTLGDPAFLSLLAGLPLDRLLLEVTEHQAVEDYAALARALAPLRRRGLRLAVDDAGAGYASLRHVLDLVPDVVKVDRAIVAGLQRSSSRRALVAALVAFVASTGAVLVAEGVEHPDELAVLRGLGVDLGQGFLLGRPGPLPAAT